MSRKEVKFMRILAITAILIFAAASLSFAAGWDACKGCHTDAGKPAPSKSDLTTKFKTADAFVKGAQASKSPMMNNYKKDDQLKAVAKELKLK